MRLATVGVAGRSQSDRADTFKGVHGVIQGFMHPGIHLESCSLQRHLGNSPQRPEVEDIHRSIQSEGRGGRSIETILGGHQVRRLPLDFAARSLFPDVALVGAEETVSRRLVDQESALGQFRQMTIADDLDSSGRSDAFQGEGENGAPSLPLCPLRVDEVGGQDRPSVAVSAGVIDRQPLAALIEYLALRIRESMQNQNIESLRSRPAVEHT